MRTVALDAELSERGRHTRVQLACAVLRGAGRLRDFGLLLLEGDWTSQDAESTLTIIKNKQSELVALLGLGKCYDHEDKKDEAIDLLENAFDEACILEEPQQRMEMTKTIGKELIEIYIKKATQCEKYNLEQGLQAY